MGLTQDDLKSCHMRETVHLNGGKEWFGYIQQCVEHPRLSRLDKYTRKDRGVQSTWRVDGQDCTDLAAALEALSVPPVVTPEERAALLNWRDHFDAAWAARVEGYTIMKMLSNKGLLDGKRGITEAGLAALQNKDTAND